jgi:glycosyltransferase involved in cell wall biosynthesis
MSPLSVLMLTPWPFRAPRHGGQLRAAAIARAYRDAGHYVASAALYDPAESTAGEVWPDDVPIAAEVLRTTRSVLRESSGEASTQVFWEAVALTPESYRAYADVVRAVQPDVVQIEELVLWPVVRRLRDEGLLGRAVVVLSAHNFETAAWADRRAAGARVSAATLRDIEALEREIAVAGDLVVAVSEDDAETFRALGARNVVVARNGTTASRAETDVLGAYIAPGAAYALFVSSAHPPNAHGLVAMAACATGHPLRHGEILVCGRVGDLVRAAPGWRRARRVLDHARYLGWVDDDVLAALYASAHAVIVPKTLGGGSNLKTADALASGRPVVATRRAFTGFDAFTEMAGITIADEPDRFWKAVDTLLSQPPAPMRHSQATASLRWEECLTPMVKATEAIVRTVGAPQRDDQAQRRLRTRCRLWRSVS